MRAANKELLEDEGHMGQANAILGKFGAKYDGTVMVRHLLWLLIDDIGLDELKKMVVKPLRGLRVAAFYGCHIIRPESVNGWESARNPHSLEDLIVALGGEAVDYAGSTRCCGFHVQLEKDGIAANMVGQNMRMAKDAGRRGGHHAVPAVPPRARRLSGRLGRALGPHRPADLPPPAARRPRAGHRSVDARYEQAHHHAGPGAPAPRSRPRARRLVRSSLAKRKVSRLRHPFFFCVRLDLRAAVAALFDETAPVDQRDEATDMITSRIGMR